MLQKTSASILDGKESKQMDSRKNRSDLVLPKNIAERKMKLFGHIVRREGLERQIVEGKMEGKRGCGRPQTFWLTDIKQWTGGSIAKSIRQAENRTGWSALVKTTAALCAN